MYPHERSLVKKLADKPFALIGVNSDRDLDKLKGVLEEENITWRSFWNGPQGTGGPISTRWNVSGWPTIYVIDAEGKIRFKNVRGSKLDEAIETLVAEAEDASAAANAIAEDAPETDAAKAAAAKDAKADAKDAEDKADAPADEKAAAADSKESATEKSDAKSADAKPAEAKPADAKPADAEPADKEASKADKPADTKEAEDVSDAPPAPKLPDSGKS